MHYDSPPYCTLENYWHEGWLYSDSEYTGRGRRETVFHGGALFKQIPYPALRKRGFTHELCWVWLHPFERNRRWLSRRWAEWRERYGKFWPQTPWSSAMNGFLEKHDPAVVETLRELREKRS